MKFHFILGVALEGREQQDRMLEFGKVYSMLVLSLNVSYSTFVAFY